MDPDVAGRLRSREVPFRCDCLSGGASPVLEKNRLQLVDDGTLESRSGVTPSRWKVRGRTPHVRDAVTECVSDPPVDHRDLAMVAMVVPCELVEPGPMIDAEVHSGPPQS